MLVTVCKLIAIGSKTFLFSMFFFIKRTIQQEKKIIMSNLIRGKSQQDLI